MIVVLFDLGLPYSPASPLDITSFLVILQSGKIFEISENIQDLGLFVKQT